MGKQGLVPKFLKLFKISRCKDLVDIRFVVYKIYVICKCSVLISRLVIFGNLNLNILMIMILRLVL